MKGSDFMLPFVDTIFRERFTPSSCHLSQSTSFSVYSVMNTIVETVEECCLQTHGSSYWENSEDIYAMVFSILSFIKDCESSQYFHKDAIDYADYGNNCQQILNDLIIQCENFNCMVKRRGMESSSQEMVRIAFISTYFLLSSK